MSSLTPGSVARIYRDGNPAASSVNVPADAPLELRNLQPGVYELRDEGGGEVEVEVTHAAEVVRVAGHLTVAQLVAALEARGLPTTGQHKRELVALVESDEGVALEPEADEPADEPEADDGAA